MLKSRPKNILVVIPTGDYPERLKLEGILKYAQERTGAKWNLELDIGGTVGQLLRTGTPTPYDGIIAYVQSDRERRSILKINLPTVLIEDLSTPAPTRRKHIVTIICNHFAEGQTAANYFLNRHYANFAFVGTEDQTGWSDLRRDGFVSTLRKRHFACSVFGGSARGLESWLRKLPKPCALLAARDLRARQVLVAALGANIAIPQDLAILGVDNDEILCKTCTPALSSIPTFDRSLGFAAGRALGQLLSGKVSGGIIRTHHSHVISRHSTDADALPDPFVARALTWAKSHLDRNLSAKTLAAAIGYSRTALVVRAHRVLGMTLADAIRHERIKQAIALLENGKMPIAEIAETCGFANVSHLCLRIKEATGLTPLAYRKSIFLRRGLHTF